MAFCNRLVVDASRVLSGRAETRGRDGYFSPEGHVLLVPPVDVVNLQPIVAEDDRVPQPALFIADLDRNSLDVGEAVALGHLLRVALSSWAHVDLRPDDARKGRIVEYADAVHEVLVA